MRRRPALIVVALMLSGGVLARAATESVALASPISDTAVTLRPYLWAPALNGDLSVGDLSVPVDVAFTDYAGNLQGALLLMSEMRQGQWSLLVDIMGMEIEDDTDTPGPAFTLVDVKLDMVMAEAAVAYDLSQSPALRAQVLAGARYIHMDVDMGLTPDVAAAEAATAQVFEQTVGRVADTVQDEVNAARDEIGADASQAAARAGDEVNDAIRDLDVSVSTSIARNELQRLDPTFDDPLATREQQAYADAVQRAIAERAAGLVEDELTPIERQDPDKVAGAIGRAASESVDTLKQNVSSQTRKALEQAEDNLVEAVGAGVAAAGDEELNVTVDWVDPFVGTRLGYALTERLALIFEGDIGGFGVGSELTWQVLGGVSWTVNDRMTIEVGYRHLDIDYVSGELEADIALSGAVMGFGFVL